MISSETITLRPMDKKDYPGVENIIRKTWKYDDLSSNPKDAAHMARLYLRSCLLRAAYSRVAESQGEVLGIILVNSKREGSKVPLGRALAQLWSILLLFTTRTGRKIGKLFRDFDETDNELLKNSNRSFDGEICFFAVSETSRGTGIGKKLFSSAMDYLQSESAGNFYLFTDSSCTYQFYERRGMRRLGEKVLEFKPHTDYKLNMFIYEGELV